MAAEALKYAVLHEDTAREAYQLLGFSMMKLQQPVAAAKAFVESVRRGSETDWQLLVELCAESPTEVGSVIAQHCRSANKASAKQKRRSGGEKAAVGGVA